MMIEVIPTIITKHAYPFFLVSGNESRHGARPCSVDASGYHVFVGHVDITLTPLIVCFTEIPSSCNTRQNWDELFMTLGRTIGRVLSTTIRQRDTSGMSKVDSSQDFRDASQDERDALIQSA